MTPIWKVPVCCLALVVLCGFSAAQVTFKQTAINSGDTSSEDQLRVTTSVSREAHTASFVVVDTFDQHVSGSVSFTSSY